MLGVRCVHRLSLVAASGGYFSLLCEGFSLQGLLLLQSTGSRHMGSAVVAQGLWRVASAVVVLRLGCSMAHGIFPDQRLNPCALHWQADS